MTESARSSHTFDDERNPSTAVVFALADEFETPQDELPSPLNDVIDPDALDSLVAASSTSVTVQFEYDQRVVTVESDGPIEVREPKDHG